MSVERATTAQTEALRELAAFPLVEAFSAAVRAASPWAMRSPTARSPTGPGTSRSPSASWSGCWC